MAHPGLSKHRKFRLLLHLLREPEPHVRGYLELLWEVGYETSDPLVGDAASVEAAAKYPGEPGQLAQALHRAGFLDLLPSGEYAIHDLIENAPKYVKDRFRMRAKREQERDTSPTVANSSEQERTCSPPTPHHSTPHHSTAGVSSEEETLEEKLPKKEACTEPAEAGRSEPAVLVFQTVGKGPKEWSLTEAKVAEYQESFPGVDVLGECRKARQWVIDNPTKRKTARGMPAFLTRWLGRVQNSGRAATGKDAPPETPEAKAERLARDRQRRGADVVPPLIPPEEADRLRRDLEALKRKG